MVKVQSPIECLCVSCDAPFTYVPIVSSITGEIIVRQVRCDKCTDRESKYQVINSPNINPDRMWENICPPLYQNTDVTQLKINPVTLRTIMDWTLGTKGIGLTGSTGSGKTRAMFLLLNQLYTANVPVMATTAKQFEHWCHSMFDKDQEARKRLERAKDVCVLFIDDIGKEKYTERVESEFYDLIEHRTSHLKPILWTANATGQQLVKMMGEDRGTPIVRRLREFSEVISV